jgi:hypothetical protein
MQERDEHDMDGARIDLAQELIVRANELTGVGGRFDDYIYPDSLDEFIVE